MGRIQGILVIACLLAWIAACDAPRKEPEDRAETFVRILTTLPLDRAQLMEYSDLQPGEPEDRLQHDIPTRVALEYMRARLQQGFELRYDRVETRLVDPDTRMVTLEIRPSRAVNERQEVTRLQVLMKQVEQRGWVVTGLQVE